MPPNDRGGLDDVACCREVGAVIDEHLRHLIGHRLDETAKEVTRNPPCRLLMEFDERELGRAVNSGEQVEPPFRRVDLRQIDMKVAQRIGLEAGPLGLVAIDLR